MSDFYSLEEAAEILKLPTAEVNRLREQGQIRAFKDGKDWKFKKDAVETLYAKLVKGQNGGNTNPFGNNDALIDDTDLLSSDDADAYSPRLADSASFADFDLSGDGMGKPVLDDSDIKNADANLGDVYSLEYMEDETDDGLQLVDDGPAVQPSSDHTLSLTDPVTEDAGEIFGIAGEPSSDSNINLAGDSGLALVGGSGGELAASDSLFDDDDLVIGGSGSGINLGGDSGISLLDAAADSGFSLGDAAGGSDAILELAADDDILALYDEDVDPNTATVLGSENDFELQVDDDLFLSDDSDSASQVISLEGDASSYGLADISDVPAKGINIKKTAAPAASASADDDLFFSDVTDSAGDNDLFGAASSPLNADPFGGDSDLSGFGSDTATTGFGGFDDPNAGAGGFDVAPDEMSTADPMAAAPSNFGPRSNEPRFSGGWVAFLCLIFLLLTFAGSLMYQLLRCMWSWSEPFSLNSTLLSLLGFGG